jgi:L-asparaginase
VEIIHGYADSNGIFVDAAIDADVAGIVFAGVGDGNGSSRTLNALKKAVEKDIKIVISSRTGSGVVYRNSEYDFDTYDFISADNLSSQKARILLMLIKNKTEKTIPTGHKSSIVLRRQIIRWSLNLFNK